MTVHPRRRPPLPLLLAVLVALPGTYLGAAYYLGLPHPELPAPLAALVYGVAIVGAAFVLSWAAWQIGRKWDRERIRYQRWCAVCEGIRRGMKFEEALAYAVNKLADEPSRGGIGVMKRDYQIEQGMSGLSRRPRRR